MASFENETDELAVSLFRKIPPTEFDHNSVNDDFERCLKSPETIERLACLDKISAGVIKVACYPEMLRILSHSFLVEVSERVHGSICALMLYQDLEEVVEVLKNQKLEIVINSLDQLDDLRKHMLKRPIDSICR